MRRPLRIAYVTATLNTGGSERMMFALAGGLPQDRFEVEFVLLTERGPLASQAEALGARVQVVGWTRRRSRLHYLHWPIDQYKLVRTLRRGHYDVVDAWLLHAYAVVALARPVGGFPVMLSGRHFMSEGLPRLGLLERFLVRLSRRRSDAIVAVSEAVRGDAVRSEGLDPARVSVIRNCVPPLPQMTASERARLREGWAVEPGDLVVGCVANYKPRKGLDLLIRVACQLHETFPGLKLVLVGEGTHRPVLEALIEEMEARGFVRLHGREEDARRLYGAFDLYAHASETEGMPGAILEAAGAGLPIVATRAGGTVEVLTDGEDGLLVPVGDAAALGAALTRLIRDPALRARLGAAARKRVETDFSPAAMVEAYGSMYEELASRAGVKR